MEFRILGPLEVIEEDGVLPLTGAKQRALLAVLLLHANEVVSSDRLIDDLWGETPPESGVTALQVRVSQLRKALEQGAAKLETRSPGYLIRVRPDELDLHRFSRLAEEADGAEPAVAAEKLRLALSLWRGPPLADFAYEPFAQAPSARLEELRLAALEKRIEADLALGRHAELVGELESLVGEHPLRERLRAQLMLALYRSRRQAEALAAYQATRRTLVEELGIEPSPALQELEKAILRQDSALELGTPPMPGRSLLVVSLDQRNLDGLLALARPLAERPAREVVVARPLPPGADVESASADLERRRELLLGDGITARAAVFTSASPGRDAVRLLAEQDVDLLLIDGPPGLLEDAILADVLATTLCDVAVLVGSEVGTGPLLVPFTGADHDWSAIEIAAWLARVQERPLVLAGPTEGERDASQLLARASLAIQRALGVAAKPRLVEPGTDGLVRAAEGSALVVVGLTDRWRKDGLGRSRAALITQAGPPVLLVRRGLRPGGLAPPESHTRFTWTLRPAT